MTMANPISEQLVKLSMLSLEDMSRRRVAALLCSDPLKYMHLAAVGNENLDTTIEARGIVFKRLVDELGIPESMREPLIHVMTPVFQETFKWLEFHEVYLQTNHLNFDYQDYLKHFCWTHLGTVNYRETAQKVIHDETLGVDQQFMFACLYCLEEDIQDLWLKLSPQGRKDFYNNGPAEHTVQRDIVAFWVSILKGRVDRLGIYLNREGRPFYFSIYQYAFEFFAFRGYETATRYFFEKLTPKERRVSLVRTANTVAEKAGVHAHVYYDVSCYLLSHMNTETVRKVLESSANGIIRIFMDWPRQDGFPEVASFILPYLKEENYNMLNFVLSLKFKFVYNSLKLFKDFFLASPKRFRHSNYYLRKFFDSKDTETFKFLFRNMDPMETLELLLKPMTLYACFELVKEEEWKFLDFFIRESGLTKGGIQRFAIEFNANFESQLDPEIREHFNKLVSSAISDQSASNDYEVYQMDPMDFQPNSDLEEDSDQLDEDSEQSDEEEDELNLRGRLSQGYVQILDAAAMRGRRYRGMEQSDEEEDQPYVVRGRPNVVRGRPNVSRARHHRLYEQSDEEDDRLSAMRARRQRLLKQSDEEDDRPGAVRARRHRLYEQSDEEDDRPNMLRGPPDVERPAKKNKNM